MNARKMLACTGSVAAESSGCHWTPRYHPVAVDGDRLDRPVRGVCGAQPRTERTQALVVITGDRQTVAVDDLAQRRVGVQLDVVHDVSVVAAGGLGHVLNQVAAARDVHHLVAAADPE